jgi:hypothetical protein
LALVVSACGSAVLPSATDIVSPTVIAPDQVQTPIPTKQPPDATVVFVGWVDGNPAIAARKARLPARWRIRSLSSAGWLDVTELPDGGMPITDGATVATILDPEGEPDVALAGPGEDVKFITVPSEQWAESWRGIHALVPLVGRTGYLFVGAAAIAVLDDEGAVAVRPVPEGYVALAPTSDPERFLLATTAAAGEPYALSEPAPFAAYLWTVGSDKAPVVLSQAVVAIAPSTSGLAWIRTDGGAWWSVSANEAVQQVTDRNPEWSVISPDGSHVLGSSDRMIGCAPATADPCTVTLIDDTGSTRAFVGPSFGSSFDGDDFGMVLDNRPSLDLPWRLVYGAADQPLTRTID